MDGQVTFMSLSKWNARSWFPTEDKLPRKKEKKKKNGQQSGASLTWVKLEQLVKNTAQKIEI